MTSADQAISSKQAKVSIAYMKGVNRLPAGLAFTVQGLDRILLFSAAGQDGAVVPDLTVASALLSRGLPEAAR